MSPTRASETAQACERTHYAIHPPACGMGPPSAQHALGHVDACELYSESAPPAPHVQHHMHAWVFSVRGAAACASQRTLRREGGCNHAMTLSARMHLQEGCEGGRDVCGAVRGRCTPSTRLCVTQIT